jgi:phage-related protein
LLRLKFYQTAGGRKPVREFLDRQTPKVNQWIYDHLRALCRMFPDTRGLDVKHLRGKLWELRIKLSDKHYRIIYAVVAGRLVILNGFIKKRRREENEIKIAHERFKDYMRELAR